MTTAAATPRVDYLEDGVTLNFPAPWRYLSPGDLTITRLRTGAAPAALVLGTDFNATPANGDAGGTITLTASVAGAKLKVRRKTGRAQGTEYLANDSFPAKTHEAALDRLTLVVQEQDATVADLTARSLLVPDGEAMPVLPAAADRISQFLGFDAQGNATLLPGTTQAPASAKLVATSGGDSADAAIEAQRFASVAAMLSSTIARRSAGRPWRAGGFDYVEAPAGVLDYHVVTLGGVLLYALPVNGAVPGEAFGAIGDGVTDCGPMLTRAAQLAKRVRLGVGQFYIGAASLPATTDSAFIGEGEATQILWSGTAAIRCRAAEGTTGAAMFSTFAYRLVVRGINFQRTSFSTTASAIYMSNVRGLWVEDCFYRNSRLLMVMHEASDSGVYNTATGSTTVDPAVVAGFSATDLTDLNEGIYARRNVSRNSQYGCQGIRINWARYGEISGNDLPFGNISWWGGGAKPAEGGQAGMLRRFAHFRIFGNYCSYNNGGVYGNNGLAVTVTGNTLEYSTDTALDFEGCVDCVATGNTVRHFGNYGCSTFYLAQNVQFRANTIEVTKAGASLSAMLGVTSFMSAIAVTGFTDNGDGTTNVTLASAPQIVSGQTVLLQFNPGGARSAVVVTRVSGTVWKIPVAFSASWAIGGFFSSQRGSGYFVATAGLGVSSTGVVQGEVTFSNNKVLANDGIMGRSSDTQIESLVIRDNDLTNCTINAPYGTGCNKVVEGNTLKYKAAAVPEQDSYAFIDVQGYSALALVRGNTIDVQAAGTWIPAGSYAINVVTNRLASGQIVARVEGNVMTKYTSAVVADGIYHSSANTVAAAAVSRITDNHVPSITDATEAGRCRVTYSGNTALQTGNALDQLAIAPGTGSTVTMLGNSRAVYLTHGATIAALTIALPVDPADGATYAITAKSAVTALTVSATPAMIGAVPAALTAGQTVRCSFSKSMNSWIWG